MVAKITGLIVLIGFCFGFYFHMENRYSIASETNKRFQECASSTDKKFQQYDYQFQTIKIKDHSTRIWQLEDRLKTNPNDQSAKEELRRLKQEKELMEIELRKIGEKK